MSVLGILFANIHDRNVPQLTRRRTMASVPFGGRYRLIDFGLSNLVNGGIDTVGVITKTNYQSLMRHVGSGKDWDLSRKNGGLVMLPPFGDTDNPLYTNRLEALKGIDRFLQQSSAEYVVMMDCDMVINLPVKDLLREHIKSEADVTGVYQYVPYGGKSHRKNTVFQLDENGRVFDMAVWQEDIGEKAMFLGVWVTSLAFLQGVVADAVARGYTSLSREVLAPNLDIIHVHGYEHRGYFACVDSMESYLHHNLALLDRQVRDQIFAVGDRPIFTKVKDSPPTRYGEGAQVNNSFIADGCLIEGTVENAILSRGVKVGKGAVVRNSMVLSEVVIGDHAVLDWMVCDRNTTIRDGRVLSGAECNPFYIEAERMI